MSSVGRFPTCLHGHMAPCPEGCGSASVAPIPGLPPRSELTLEIIDAHLKSMSLRSHVSWRGGEWTVRLTSRKEEHNNTATWRRAVGRSSFIEEAFARALNEWEKK
jgi:hypothetical protein